MLKTGETGKEEVKAPNFRLKAVNGVYVELKSLRGKPVLLDFWATWCPPCKAELEVLKKVNAEYAGKITIISIDVGEDPDLVASFVTRHGITWTVLLDVKGEVARAYGVKGIPTLFFVDENGAIRWVHVGYVSYEKLKSMIDKELGG